MTGLITTMESLETMKSMKSMDSMEIISLIFGNSKECRIDAQRVVSHFKNLKNLSQSSYTDLLEIKGITPKRAMMLFACLELGWRMVAKPWNLGESFRGSHQVYENFRSFMGRESVEVVWLLLLDARLRKLDSFEISRGALTGAIVHPRDVLHQVIKRQAPAFVLIHNHPSGDPSPSRSDFSITRKIRQAAQILQVDFLDHVIVAQNGYYSFADQRKL